MGVTNAVLIEAKYAENSQTTQYTSTGVRTMIDKFSAINTSAGPAVLTVNLIAPAGSAAATNVCMVKTLAAGEAYSFPEIAGHNLAVGGLISTLCDTASAIVIRASGRQIS